MEVARMRVSVVCVKIETKEETKEETYTYALATASVAKDLAAHSTVVPPAVHSELVLTIVAHLAYFVWHP
jgi:hypothetical protein